MPAVANRIPRYRPAEAANRRARAGSPVRAQARPRTMRPPSSGNAGSRLNPPSRRFIAPIAKATRADPVQRPAADDLAEPGE